ncbi:hypothetical protein [Pseudomonas paracarnis]|uniref:Uncharacterized protein n=1 Tax=Pseudomonas paracarnis TaxID=2750625 RepID=A0ABU6BUL5_9PSED|nr:hypothetical protein [Pseudomonas paracarnis]MBW9244109.1 hypothetical protein [Pseudomonas paracarnis]MEB3783728.1 hypothetical protein [Pseudomonas paracarnis]
MNIIGELAQQLYQIRIDLGLVDPQKTEEDISERLPVKDSIKQGRTLEEKNLRRCLPDGLSVVLGRNQIKQLVAENCPQYAFSKVRNSDEMLGLPIVRLDVDSYLAVEVRQETLDKVLDLDEAHEQALAHQGASAE